MNNMEEQVLIQFNDRLDNEVLANRVNEGSLEKTMLELEAFNGGCSEIYWLSLARVTELCLICAGDYADSGEFTAAGDLLLNPRLVLVHVKGRKEPVVKRRHAALTRQLMPLAGEETEMIPWLKKETILEVRERSLLPSLYDRLGGSGYFSEAYLDSVFNRMKKIADTIVFLASRYPGDGRRVYQQSKWASPSERAFIESGLCRFDLSVFLELGREIQMLIRDRGYESRFLLPGLRPRNRIPFPPEGDGMHPTAQEGRILSGISCDSP